MGGHSKAWKKVGKLRLIVSTSSHIISLKERQTIGLGSLQFNSTRFNPTQKQDGPIQSSPLNIHLCQLHDIHSFDSLIRLFYHLRSRPSKYLDLKAWPMPVVTRPATAAAPDGDGLSLPPVLLVLVVLVLPTVMMLAVLPMPLIRAYSSADCVTLASSRSLNELPMLGEVSLPGPRVVAAPGFGLGLGLLPARLDADDVRRVW